MTLDAAAERIAEYAVQCADAVMDPGAKLSWAEAAEVLMTCSSIVAAARFGPAGGCTQYEFDSPPPTTTAIGFE